MAGQATGYEGRFGLWRQASPRAEARPAIAMVPPAPREAIRPAQLRDLATAPFAGRRSLVADDNEMNRMILRTFLERLGLEVTLAADGIEAVRLWRPDHDLLCLDIQMPGQDGLRALADIRVRVAAQGGVMPLALAVTVNSLSHQVTEYLSSGFDACLPKPFARAELQALLHDRWG